ncbi:IS110 family transposase [Thalassomonas actiniarum]|uniref:IS110 family transposase n=1 Tax=Thalassomonas actiniarum TaxID=485447 RepID=A0AAE9YP13_9GAMM|nr:IS110 family transposase [Thalassomonas actiniarum]
MIAEPGDLKRFEHPRKLMTYLGLVPNKHTSSDKQRLSAVTECGNGRARRLLVGGVHGYKYKANVSTEYCRVY